MSAHSSELLSVIVPCYNEEEGLLAAIERLTAVLGGANIPYELIFVYDGHHRKSVQKGQPCAWDLLQPQLWKRGRYAGRACVCKWGLRDCH